MFTPVSLLEQRVIDYVDNCQMLGPLSLSEIAVRYGVSKSYARLIIRRADPELAALHLANPNPTAASGWRIEPTDDAYVLGLSLRPRMVARMTEHARDTARLDANLMTQWPELLTAYEDAQVVLSHIISVLATANPGAATPGP